MEDPLKEDAMLAPVREQGTTEPQAIADHLK